MCFVVVGQMRHAWQGAAPHAGDAEQMSESTNRLFARRRVNFHGDMRQCLESPQPLVIKLRPAMRLACAHRDHRAQVARADAPYVQVEQRVAIGLQRRLDAPADMLVRRHVDRPV